MPTISNLTLSLVKDVANMDVTFEYDIEWTRSTRRPISSSTSPGS